MMSLTTSVSIYIKAYLKNMRHSVVVMVMTWHRLICTTKHAAYVGRLLTVKKPYGVTVKALTRM